MWIPGRCLRTLKSSLAVAAFSFATVLVIIGCSMTPPKAKGGTLPIYLTVGESDTVDASDFFFAGINAGTTDYSVRSENSSVVAVEIYSSTITMTAIATGRSKISITATNGAGSAHHSFTAIVTEGSADRPTDGPTVPPIASVPPPIDLPINNILQETEVWCWAAVAQQIIAHAQGIQNTPAQCALVAIANSAFPRLCCQIPTPSQCVVPGSLQQIQFLIGYFGGRYSSLAPPTDPVTLYRVLQSGRPVIMSVQSPYTSIGHVVVIRGMTWVPVSGRYVPVLHVNDPLSYFTKPIPFADLARFWRQAIIVEAM